MGVWEYGIDKQATINIYANHIECFNDQAHAFHV